MKVKIFNTENVPTVRKTTPTIYLNYKSGLISINKSSSELMGLKDGDGVEFAQDEEEPESWYIFKSKSGGAFVLREDNGKFMTNNSGIVRRILDSLSINFSCSPRIALEPEKINKVDMFAILTASITKPE